MSRTHSCNYPRSCVVEVADRGGDDVTNHGWMTPPSSPEMRRFLRRHAAKTRRRLDRRLIRDATELTAPEACVLGALRFLTAA